jgi:hypothetical protein
LTDEANLYYRGISLPQEETLEDYLDILANSDDKKLDCCQVLASGDHLERLKKIFETLEAKLIQSRSAHPLVYQQTMEKMHILGLILKKMGKPFDFNII